MRTLVSSELDVGILEELRANHVAESMVLLVESEDGSVGGACLYQ